MMYASKERKWKLPLFWILQIGGWSALTASYLFILWFAEVTDPRAVRGVIVTESGGFIVTSLLRYVYQRVRRAGRSVGVMALIVIGMSVLATNVWFLLGTLWAWVVKGTLVAGDFKDPSMWMAGILSQSPIIIMWSAFYFSIRTWQDWSNEKRHAVESAQLAAATEMQMLRYQLNPHFLFNALNSIRALIDEDQSNAKRAVTELAEFLRYSLVSKSGAEVPLRDELEAVRHYFAIQKIRYEHRLTVIEEIEPRAEEFPVLSYLIQPLVENAIKYGMETSAMPLQIKLQATVNQDKLFLVVANTGRWIPPSPLSTKSNGGTGAGLENVQRRLNNALPGRHHFSHDEDNGWVNVKIEISRQGER